MARIEGKATRAYHQIERMIVFQEIAPGSLISESEMMESTGLGRTPVREALQRLARSRMVEIHPNKGGYKKLSGLISPILAALLA